MTWRLGTLLVAAMAGLAGAGWLWMGSSDATVRAPEAAADGSGPAEVTGAARAEDCDTPGEPTPAQAPVAQFIEPPCDAGAPATVPGGASSPDSTRPR
jgi:hypothetical protein